MSAEATTLVAPDGRRYDVPTAQGAAELRSKGFRDLNDDEKRDAELQTKYGEGLLPPIAAAASGMVSGATFGASDFVMRGLAPGAADISNELAQRNPTAHTTGQIGSLLVPFLGAAGVAGKVARVGGAGITSVTKGAQALGAGARAAAEAVGLKGAAPIIGGAVTAATEGVAFQVGSNLAEASRRDAKLDAETLLAHVGEAAYLGAGLGAAIPAAGKVVHWSADKALVGLEAGVQQLRKAGFGIANIGVDAVDAGAGALSRNAGAIGIGVAAGARGAADLVEAGAGAVVGRADAIGGAVEAASGKIGQFADDTLLPKIRAGLTEQTGRADIINEVFATGAEGRALREKLGSETITGTREAQSKELGKAVNTIWEQTRSNAPMFDDLAIAVKRDMQESALSASSMSKKQQSATVKTIIGEANKTLDELAKYNPTAKTYFQDALTDFAKTALTERSPAAIYRGLDGLKTATDKIAKFAKGAQLGDSGAAFAAEEARRFRTFAKSTLEDTKIWGAAGQVQQEVNAAYTKYKRAFDQFEKNFAGPKAAGQPARVLDGNKVQQWSKQITGQGGELRNAVVDDLVEAQRELISLTGKLAKQAGTVRPLGALATGAESAEALAATKLSATAAIDRAEVLQQTQNKILSRQGAGVNPLPVEMARQLGAGTLVGGVIGGIPGAIVGGGISSVLQKYGAITSNPKSAIELLNTIDRLRGVNKERVAGWVRSTLGGVGDSAQGLARRVDAQKIAAAIRSGAEATRSTLPGARASIAGANAAAAKRILDAGRQAQTGLANASSSASASYMSIMRKVLPATAYASVTQSSDEWWRQTQRTLVSAQANPDKLAELIDSEVASIAESIPGTAMAIADQKMRVVGFLVDKMPRNPRPMMIGTAPWKPNAGELKDFRDVALVATQPDALLPLLSAGLATKAQIGAVKELWPSTYATMKAQITDAVITAAADGKPVPYESRIRLGYLLETPLDASQEPGFGAWVQAMSGSQKSDEKKPARVGSNLNLNTDTGLPFSARVAQRK